jgi:3-isopropylmalate/(R)-2-methylmalate dehydratase small subunit
MTTQRTVHGKVYVVGDHIDTDQIIPAEYLSYNPANPDERKYFGRYALSGLPADQAGLPDGNVPFTAEDRFESDFGILLGGTNFGCGSSREHAPLAIAEAGCRYIVAQDYARIFYRNCVNGGYCAPLESTQRLVEQFRTGDEADLDLDRQRLSNLRTGASFDLHPLGDAEDIIRAGGVFNYARQAGMLKS